MNADIKEGGVEPPVPPIIQKGVVGTYAQYAMCPMCGNIMSGKVKKLVRIGKEAWVHRGTCAARFASFASQMRDKRIRQVYEDEAKRAAVAAPTVEETNEKEITA